MPRQRVVDALGRDVKAFVRFEFLRRVCRWMLTSSAGIFLSFRGRGRGRKFRRWWKLFVCVTSDLWEETVEEIVWRIFKTTRLLFYKLSIPSLKKYPIENDEIHYPSNSVKYWTTRRQIRLTIPSSLASPRGVKSWSFEFRNETSPEGDYVFASAISSIISSNPSLPLPSLNEIIIIII